MTTVFPRHLTFTLPDIVFELSFINIAICPDKSSQASFLIFREMSLVLVSFRVAPCTLPFSQSSDEIAFIQRSVFPGIFSITMRMPVFVVSLIDIPIVEMLEAFTMLDKFAEIP
jgi:hypothetical protein